MLLVLLLAATASADPAPDVHKMHDDDCARARKQGKTCVLSIESEELEGTKIMPGESPINVRLFDGYQSLITLRRDFIPEILKSAEDL